MNNNMDWKNIPAPTPPPQIYHQPPPFDDIPDRMGLSILNLFCCPLLGIPALIFASQISSSKAMGNYVDARSKSDTVKVLNLIGIIVGSITLLAVLAYIIFIFVIFSSAMYW